MCSTISQLADPVRTTGTVRKRQAVRPVQHNHTNHTCRVTLLQLARQAAGLGQPSSLRPHWRDHLKAVAESAQFSVGKQDTEGNQSDCPSIQLVIFMVIMPGEGGRGQSGSCTLETLSPSFFVVCFLMHTDEVVFSFSWLSHSNLFTNMTLAVTIYIGSQPSKVSHNHTPTHVLYPRPRQQFQEITGLEPLPSKCNALYF